MFQARPGAAADKKAALIAQAKAERLARSGLKKLEQQNALHETAASRIQKFWRRLSARRAVRDQQRADWDILAAQAPATPALGLVRNLKLAFLLIRFHDPLACPKDTWRLGTLCKLLLSKTVIAATWTGASIPVGDMNKSTMDYSPTCSPTLETGATPSISDQKPVMQAPFQMALLHARFSTLSAATILRLLQLCVKAISGYQVDSSCDSGTTGSNEARSSALSPKFGTSHPSSEELYLSGPELRFLMAFVDVNTFRLPDTVSPAIRTQMLERGTSLIIRTLDSGKFYKEIRIGVMLRAESLVQLQERAKKTMPTANEVSRQKGLALWITAIWRCCLLLQSVDKDLTEKSMSTARNKYHKDNLINLHSDDSTVVGIACNILTVPLFVDCLDDLCIQQALKSNVLKETLDAIMDIRHQQYILSALSLNHALFLLGNLVQLYRITMEKDSSQINANLKIRVVDVAVVLLTHCQKYASGTQTTEFRHYHPVFSWTSISQKEQQLTTAQAKMLFMQLEQLWSRDFALGIFHTLLDLSLPLANAGASAIIDPLSETATRNTSPAPAATNHHHQVVQSESKLGHKSSDASDPQGTLLAIEVQQACLFYMTLMKSFESQKTKILVTLMYLPSFLTQLWRFMATLGPKGGMRIYLEAASGNVSKGLEQEPLIAILQVFCECCARFLVTLDDDDMYEQQKPWELSELVFMSGFLNQFCFSVLSQQEDPGMQTEPKEISATMTPSTTATALPPLPPLLPIFYHARQVLMQLYERDCRRTFCPANHWLLMHPTKSAFQSPLQILAALSLSGNNRSKGGVTGTTTKKNGGFFSFASSKAPPQYATPKEFISKVSQKDRTALQILETMPHVIPFNARLEIFRDFIKEEKVQRAQSLALVRPDLHQAVMVKVRRGYVLEDGYQNLGQLSVSGWKNTIRVKFVNEVGADEAGIDQGGPFKEFMESFLEAGFSPNLNLFTTTTASMNMLYPSPTAQYTHPGTWLELFRLFGRMLGKAMYEGLLVEVKFANFFLSKILGRTVFLDEMRSFDEQVFRNLMFLKKYEGNVEDLGLTFTLDEEVFGTHRTVELLRGGKDIEVTKENRINYIFQVSDYRLNKQIQDQSRAFIEGFRSIIPLPWISIFTPQELHRVMAGDDVDFDVQDLRAHTEYQNGYFDQHPVIRNLWAVLNEFNSEEKRAFLKFVTSCSKPPLGGFKYLHPPFAIRLVMNPTTTDQNPGSTVAPTPRLFGSGAARVPHTQVSRGHGQQQSLAAATSSGSGSGGGSAGRGFGSRLRSAFGGDRIDRSGSIATSSNGSSSSAASMSSISSASSGPNQSSSPFALTTDEHGTPAAMGVVKSFFGGVLGGGISGSGDGAGKKARLPTSSTCFNLLKLPPFSSKSVLKEKLRYAIMSNTGFELS
ncbi:Ubiquitin-protein ligase E3B [Mortierella sp. GBA30]|nr:Ubiquitin-protein ligase E3B [Mortierella sp. GBA30]